MFRYSILLIDLFHHWFLVVKYYFLNLNSYSYSFIDIFWISVTYFNKQMSVINLFSRTFSKYDWIEVYMNWFFTIFIKTNVYINYSRIFLWPELIMESNKPSKLSYYHNWVSIIERTPKYHNPFNTSKFDIIDQHRSFHNE